MTDIRNHFYVVRLSKKEDYEQAPYGDPWIIDDYYLIVGSWSPSFNPFTVGLQKMQVWVRFPELSIQFYNKEFLKRVGNRLGKTLRVDETTLMASRGRFARISVEVDLHQPLISMFMFRQRVR